MANNKNRKIIWGMSGLSHDASLSVLIRPGLNYAQSNEDRLVYASHAERYSRVKNDARIHAHQVKEALAYGPPDLVCWFENPLLKRLRYATSGMWREVLNPENDVRRMIHGDLKIDAPIRMGNHHRSHASAAYFTRPLHWSDRDSCDVLVADAIGEFETLTCWTNDRLRPHALKQIGKSMRYPQSLGLMYTAVTQFCGLKPNEEEFILMGMAAYGSPSAKIINRLYAFLEDKTNLHRGLPEYFSGESRETLAASAQAVIEDAMVILATQLRISTGSRYLCLSGGVALNCVANAEIARRAGYEDVWIMPNPGDAGSSLGAILDYTRQRIQFDDCFLGTEIPAILPDAQIAQRILDKGMIGLARGRAEWGPRSLGNRSLLADPRTKDIKDRVNTIKRRQKFRPFAPMVLAEYADYFFDLPRATQLGYMQYAVKCKRPDLIPGVIHADGTSRLQVVNKGHPIRGVLEEWFRLTGCPVLLNTSLNIKGEPLVNSYFDAIRFRHHHDIEVLN